MHWTHYAKGGNVTGYTNLGKHNRVTIIMSLTGVIGIPAAIPFIIIASMRHLPLLPTTSLITAVIITFTATFLIAYTEK